MAIPDSGDNLDTPVSVKKDDPTFFLVPELNNREPSTSIMSNKSKIRIDFLTIRRSNADSRPHFYPDLNIAATPLRFMDYLIGRNVQRGLIVGGFRHPGERARSNQIGNSWTRYRAGTYGSGGNKISKQHPASD